MLSQFLDAFHLRDIRGGQGQRKLFYEQMQHLYEVYPYMAKGMLWLIPVYGCWRDYWVLYDMVPGFRREIIGIVTKQFTDDLAAAEEGSPISLMAKWLPREKANPVLAQTFADAIFPNLPTDRARIIQYRKSTSFLNTCLQTVEIDMCAKRWHRITHLPSRCRQYHLRSLLHENKSCCAHFQNLPDPKVQPRYSIDSERYDMVRDYYALPPVPQECLSDYFAVHIV